MQVAVSSVSLGGSAGDYFMIYCFVTLIRTLPLLPLLLFNSRIPMFSQAAQAAFLFLQDLRFGTRIAQVE